MRSASVRSVSSESSRARVDMRNQVELTCDEYDPKWRSARDDVASRRTGLGMTLHRGDLEHQFSASCISMRSASIFMNVAGLYSINAFALASR